jgi:hypothetical protein
MRSSFDRDDYSVVVKLRAELPCPWRWEIYCAGKRMPVERSPTLFASRGAAQLSGKAALTRLIDKLGLRRLP